MQVWEWMETCPLEPAKEPEIQQLRGALQAIDNNALLYAMHLAFAVVLKLLEGKQGRWSWQPTMPIWS
jgi:hypothetical protein